MSNDKITAAVREPYDAMGPIDAPNPPAARSTLADVQPGGMVRLATVPYDRARDLIGDAYNAGTHGIGYSQQAMELHDAIIPAQPSQVAYHGDVDLKWLSGSIGEVAHRLSTYMPTGLAEWADRARDCRIAAQVLSELSAQPSPGGQDALAALQQDYDKLLDSFNRQVEVAEKIAGRALQQDDRIEELEEALAARQPVGEPVAWMDPDGSRVLTAKAKANASGAYKSATSGYTVPLYPPAQAVDLDAVRALLQRRIEQWRSHLPADPGAPGTREIETKGEHDYNNDVAIYRQGIAVMEEVLFKIDSQAVGNG